MHFIYFELLIVLIFHEFHRKYAETIHQTMHYWDWRHRMFRHSSVYLLLMSRWSPSLSPSPAWSSANPSEWSQQTRRRSMIPDGNLWYFHRFRVAPLEHPGIWTHLTYSSTVQCLFGNDHSVYASKLRAAETDIQVGIPEFHGSTRCNMASPQVLWCSNAWNGQTYFVF